MKCKKCGKEFEGNFCPHCGTPASDNSCPKCGKEREPGVRYCSGCGYDFQATPSAGEKIKCVGSNIGAKIKSVPKKTWIIISAVAVAVVAVIVAVVLLTSFFSNKFRIGVAEKIDIGDSKQQVIDLLGEPYDYDENSSVFEYYSDNYLSLLKQNDSLDPDDIEDFDDLEGAFEDAFELEQRLQTEEYKYIEVRFDSDDCVTSVFFDNCRTEETKHEDKAMKRYNVLTDISSIINIGESVTYQEYYTDGSYYLDDVSITLNIDGATCSISWYDNYGNEIVHPLSESAIQDTYDEDTGTLYIISDDLYPETIPTDLKAVIIYGGVTSIADGTFENCNSLTSVTIADSVTSIGERAFYSCSALTSITIGNGVTSIGEDAFAYCSALTSVTMPTIAIPYIPKTNLQTVVITSGLSIEDGAFDWCEELTSITITDSVTSIGDNAFYCCSGLTSITIPDSVTNIGEKAFADCSGLTSITIGNSVTNIGDNAFSFCYGLTEIHYNGNITSWCKISGLGNLMSSQALYIDGEAITGELMIPGSVTSISDYAFKGCIGLTSVTIGNGVTSIGECAFRNCSGLTSITIPDSVTSIGYSAFWNCSGLTSITIGSGVTDIDLAFTGCFKLTSVYYKGTAEEWEKISIITISSDNEHLLNATRYYYSETQPTEEGNYWHYDMDGKTPVIWMKKVA